MQHKTKKKQNTENKQKTCKQFIGNNNKVQNFLDDHCCIGIQLAIFPQYSRLIHKQCLLCLLLKPSHGKGSHVYGCSRCIGKRSGGAWAISPREYLLIFQSWSIAVAWSSCSRKLKKLWVAAPVAVVGGGAISPRGHLLLSLSWGARGGRGATANLQGQQ